MGSPISEHRQSRQEVEYQEDWSPLAVSRLRPSPEYAPARDAFAKRETVFVKREADLSRNAKRET